MPQEKPDRPLSSAMARNYRAYMGIRPETNALYTQFNYTKLTGFDYNDGDGTISRRDPSKVIYANGKYYLWYTYRNTPVPPQGPNRCSDVIPSTDWDLAEIWYATSVDGFTWEEQGVAVPRPPKPHIGWRSVSTPDILVWQGKYYLYYQGFVEASGIRGDYCPVALSYADSPDGPWQAHHQIVLPNGVRGEWDQDSIHDPYPLVHDGKIYLYYKSDSARDAANPNYVRMQGLAIADHPLGPFNKHPLNPVLNSGHETTLFPFKQGVAAFAIRNGNEANTIQYAEDWVNFEIAAIAQLMPDAAGPFVPDAFTNTTDGRGITWGISHLAQIDDRTKTHFVLTRFDCDLSQEINDPAMKDHHVPYEADFLYKHGLSEEQRTRIAQETARLREQ